MITTLVVLLLLAQNPTVTPGLTRPLTTETVCTTRWGLDQRRVTIGMKKRTAKAYGVQWEDRGRYVFDHLVPRSLAGADHELNLWPQSKTEAKRKDRVEIKLSKLVCAGQLPLSVAQKAIRTNWRAAYRRYVVGATPKS